MKFQLKLGHLYPEHMNLYGDRGNILALQHRAKHRGIDLEITPIGFNEQVNPNVVDLLFLGGGQDAQQLRIASDLQEKADGIREAVSNGAVMLGICGGFQLMGHYYQPHEGSRLEGLSLVDAFTIAGDKRLIGNVLVARPNGQKVVGFENHSGKTYLGTTVRSLGKVISGFGNNSEDGLEGVAEGNLYGTYLHGSLLPKNPQLTDELLEKAFRRCYGEEIPFPQYEGNEQFETMAHERIIQWLS